MANQDSPRSPGDGSPSRRHRQNAKSGAARKPEGNRGGGKRQGPPKGGKRPSGGKQPGRDRNREPRGERGLWFYGQHAVEAAIRNPRRQIKTLLATEEAMARMPLLQRGGLQITPSSPADLDRRLPRDAAHQGVAAEVNPLAPLQLDRVIAIQPEKSFVLALDQVTDPRNLGAILRSAVGLGVQAVIVPERRSAPLNGAAAKAASGAVDLLPIVEVVNLSRALERLKAADYWITGLDGESNRSVADASSVKRRVLVLGSEGDGMRRLTGERCDEILSIAIDKRMESLNVSVAAGIAIHELARIDRRG